MSYAARGSAWRLDRGNVNSNVKLKQQQLLQQASCMSSLLGRLTVMHLRADQQASSTPHGPKQRLHMSKQAASLH